MQTLVEAISALARAGSVPEVIGIVRHAAKSLTHADGVTFVLQEEGYCYYADEEAIGPLWKGSRFPLKSCISGWAMLNRQMVVIADIYQDPRIPHEAYRPTFVKSLVMVPVQQQEAVAAIGAYWAQQHEASWEEQRILQLLANAAALALREIPPGPEARAS